MKKIFLILCVSIVVLLLASCEEKTVQIGETVLDASKVYTIFIAQSKEDSILNEMRKGFVIGLKNLGLVEDVNVKYIYECAKGEKNYANQIVDAVVEKNPDLVVAIGDITTKALFDNCKNIPIVFLGCANAEKLGFCDSNNMPTSNMTGVRDSHLINERLSYIQKEYPNIKNLGIIYTANSIMANYDVDYFKFYATSYGIDIFTVSIKKIADIDKALDNIIPKVDGIALVIDDEINNVVEKIVERANSENKPVFGRMQEHKDKGCIVDNIPDYQIVGKEGAIITNDILVNQKNVNEIAIKEILN